MKLKCFTSSLSRYCRPLTIPAASTTVTMPVYSSMAKNWLPSPSRSYWTRSLISSWSFARACTTMVPWKKTKELQRFACTKGETEQTNITSWNRSIIWTRSTKVAFMIMTESRICIEWWQLRHVPSMVISIPQSNLSIHAERRTMLASIC